VACRRVKLKAIFNINIMKGGRSQEIFFDNVKKRGLRHKPQPSFSLTVQLIG
jgi:hypothetical protein